LFLDLSFNPGLSCADSSILYSAPDGVGFLESSGNLVEVLVKDRASWGWTSFSSEDEHVRRHTTVPAKIIASIGDFSEDLIDCRPFLGIGPGTADCPSKCPVLSFKLPVLFRGFGSGEDMLNGMA